MPIYINEDLTEVWATLFSKALKNHKPKSSWTVDGNFFVQDTYSWVKIVRNDIQLNVYA